MHFLFIKLQPFHYCQAVNRNALNDSIHLQPTITSVDAIRDNCTIAPTTLNLRKQKFPRTCTKRLQHQQRWLQNSAPSEPPLTQVESTPHAYCIDIEKGWRHMLYRNTHILLLKSLLLQSFFPHPTKPIFIQMFTYHYLTCLIPNV